MYLIGPYTFLSETQRIMIHIKLWEYLYNRGSNLRSLPILSSDITIRVGLNNIIYILNKLYKRDMKKLMKSIYSVRQYIQRSNCKWIYLVRGGERSQPYLYEVGHASQSQETFNYQRNFYFFSTLICAFLIF